MEQFIVLQGYDIFMNIFGGYLWQQISSVSLWEQGGSQGNCVKKSTFFFLGQCVNISFELQQNAITETQMFFVS